MEDTFYYFLHILKDIQMKINRFKLVDKLFWWLRSFILFFVIRKSKIINVEFLIVHSSKNTVKKILVKEDCKLVNLGVLQWIIV